MSETKLLNGFTIKNRFIIVQWAQVNLRRRYNFGFLCSSDFLQNNRYSDHHR